MFDIGWTELLVLAVVAILIVGPKELPRMLRTLGNYAGKMRKLANDFRSQFDDAIREAELDEVRSSVENIRNIDPLKDVKSSLKDGFEPLRSDADDIKRKAESPAKGSKPDAKPERPSSDKAAAEPQADTDSASAPAPETGKAKPKKAKTRASAKSRTPATGSGA